MVAGAPAPPALAKDLTALKTVLEPLALVQPFFDGFANAKVSAWEDYLDAYPSKLLPTTPHHSRDAFTHRSGGPNGCRVGAPCGRRIW